MRNHRQVTENTDETFRALTRATRAADQLHQTTGGGTRHWLRECFLPELELEGLAIVDIAKHLTHGRHCACRACEHEDWTKITSPCGMHGESCPAAYDPIGVAGMRLNELEEGWQDPAAGHETGSHRRPS